MRYLSIALLLGGCAGSRVASQDGWDTVLPDGWEAVPQGAWSSSTCVYAEPAGYSASGTTNPLASGLAARSTTRIPDDLR